MCVICQQMSIIHRQILFIQWMWLLLFFSLDGPDKMCQRNSVFYCMCTFGIHIFVYGFRFIIGLQFFACVCIFRERNQFIKSYVVMTFYYINLVKQNVINLNRGRCVRCAAPKHHYTAV